MPKIEGLVRGKIEGLVRGEGRVRFNKRREGVLNKGPDTVVNNGFT